MYTYSRHASFFRAVCHIGVTSRLISRRDRRTPFGAMTLVCSKVFCTSQPCNTIVLTARNMETLSGAKFEPFSDHNCRLRRFCSVKPTYSDREIHKLKAGFHMIADRRSRIADRNEVCDRLRSYGNYFCDRLRSCNRDRRRLQKIEPCSIYRVVSI